MSSSQKGLSFRESHYDDDDSSTNNTTTPLPSVAVDVASDNADWMLLVAGCKFDQSYDTTETCCDDTISSYDDLSEGHGDDEIYEMLVSSIPPLLRVGGVAVGAGDEDYQLEYPGMQYWEETLEHYQEPFREPLALARFSSFEDDLSVDSLLVHIRRQQSRRVVAPSADKEACSSQGKEFSEEDDEAHHDARQYPDHSSVQSCTETLRSEDARADHEKQSETRTRRRLVPPAPLSPGVVAQQEERRQVLRHTYNTDSVDSLTRVTIARRRRQRRSDRRSSE